jgi:hypothetical protein
MLKDRVMAGAIIGLLANAVKLTFNFSAFLLGFTPVVFWQLVAAQFLAREDLYKPAAYIIGGTADLAITALLGATFVYFIYYFGDEYLYFKGLGFGLVVWAALFGSLFAARIQDKIHPEPAGILVTLIAHSLFGLSLAFFTNKYWLSR